MNMVKLLKSRWLPLLVFGLIHVLVNMLLFTGSFYEGNYSAAGLFYDYASKIFQGQIPYQDFLVEYPPLSLLFFILPRLAGPGFSLYYGLFLIEIVIFDLIALFVIEDLARRLKLPVWETLFIFTLALVATGPIIINRYDIIPAVMVLLALYAYILGKNRLSWAILAVAVMTKVYPLVIAPVFFIDLLCSRRYKAVIFGGISFAAVCIVIMVPFIVLSPEHFGDFFGYHMQRGLQIESLYSSFLLWGQVVGTTSVQIDFSYGAWNIVSPLADRWVAASPFIVVLSLLLVYWCFFRYRRHTDGFGTPAVIQYSLAAVAFFIVTCKVFSPQFIIWLYPMIPLVTGRWRYPSWIIYLIIGVMTYYIFPTHYSDLEVFDSTVIGITVFRNLLLLGLAVLWLFYKDKSREPKKLNHR
jgi:uncharacterized membrane protein